MSHEPGSPTRRRYVSGYLWALGLTLIAFAAAPLGAANRTLALGVVIRGGTPHFEYVASELNKGVAQVILQTGTPVSNGVITADTLEQAIERAGTKMGNKGFDASVSAIEMANLMKNMG